MGGYLPNTEAQRREMLEAIGIASLEELYAMAPAELLQKEGPNIPEGLSEWALERKFTDMAAKNTVYPSVFRGAGAYRHYIPAVVRAVTAKETFVTAYTPYQAEISQGILQSIFEYQTMICELTGMEASNASVYDGASAAAEAMAMCREKKRHRALVADNAPPEVIETMKSYAWASGMEIAMLPSKDGRLDLGALEGLLDDASACVYLQQPNYFGLLEDAEAVAEAVHARGAKLIMGVNPIAAALYKTPGECGADIAVGEGQPLGMPLSYGGPYLGFMAAKSSLMRKLPGRIVGETRDAQGRRAFVLTLQAREQHIRREKASSNICSNQALCAMTAACYMASMGPGGLEEVARQCHSKAQYLATALEEAGYPRLHEGAFFHEFVTRCPASPEALLSALKREGILGGLPVKGGILWCATEMNTREEMDKLAAIAKEVAKG